MGAFSLQDAYGGGTGASGGGAAPAVPGPAAPGPSAAAPAEPAAPAAFSLDDAYKPAAAADDNIPKGWMVKPGRDGFDRVEEIYNPKTGKMQQHGVAAGGSSHFLGERDIEAGEFDAPRRAGTNKNPAALEPTKADDGAAHTLKLGTQNFNEGIAEALGAPVDLTTMLVNVGARKLGLSEIEHPLGGSESLKGLMDTLGVLSHEQPHETSGRIFGRIMKEIGGLTVPMGAEVGAAAKLGARTAKGLAAPLVEPMRVAPGRTIATEAGLGTSAGAGAGGARELADPNDPTSVAAADLAGVLFGGVAPLGAATAVKRAAGALPAMTKAGRESRVARALKVTPLKGAELRRAAEGAPDVPGVQYDTASLLNDADLLASLRAESRRGPEAARAMLKRIAENNAALRAEATAAAPEGTGEAVRPAVARQAAGVGRRLEAAVETARETGTAGTAAAREAATEGTGAARAEADALRTGADQEVAGRAAALDKQTGAAVETAQTAADQAHVPLAPRRTAEEASTAAHGELRTAEGEAQQQAGKHYAEVGPGGELTLPTGYVAEAKNTVASRQGDLGNPANLPAIMRDGRLEKLGDAVSFQTLVQLGSELKNEARMAAPTGNRILASNIRTLEEAVDRTLDDLANGTMPLRRAAEDAGAREAEVGLTEAAARPHVEAAETARQGADARAAPASEAPVAAPELRADELAGGVPGERGPVRGGGPADGAGGSAVRSAGDAPGSGRPGGVAEGGADALAETAEAVRKRRFADQWFRENVAEKFRRGPVAKVLRRGAGGEPDAVAPTTALSQFVKPADKGGEEAIGAFVRAVGDRPAAVEALRDYVVDRLADATRANGKVSAVRMQEFVERYSPVFRQFPELERDVKNVAALQKRVDDVLAQRAAALEAHETEAGATRRMAEETGRTGVAAAEREGKAGVQAAERAGKEGVARAQGRQQRSRAAVEESAAQFWLDGSPSNAVGRVLGAKDPAQSARETMSFVRKDPEAAAGVARAAWDHVIANMFSKAEGAGVNVASARRYLDKNEDALRVLMGDERFERATKLVDAAAMNMRAANAKLPGGSDTAQNLQALAEQPEKHSLIGQIVHHGMTAIGGAAGHGAGAIVGHTTGEALRTMVEHRVGATLRLFQEALIDPQVYQTLVTRVTKDNEKALRDRLATHLVNLGLASSNKPTEQR